MDVPYEPSCWQLTIGGNFLSADVSGGGSLWSNSSIPPEVSSAIQPESRNDCKYMGSSLASLSLSLSQYALAWECELPWLNYRRICALASHISFSLSSISPVCGKSSVQDDIRRFQHHGHIQLGGNSHHNFRETIHHPLSWLGRVQAFELC